MGFYRNVKRTCAMCGKDFETFSDEWGYTIRLNESDETPLYFCSYSCLRKFEKPLIEKSKKKAIKNNLYNT